MPYAHAVPPQKTKSLRPFFDQLLNTSTSLDDMLAELDLSKEESEQLINSEKFRTHRALRAQLIQQQLQIAAQNHARSALETLANLTNSSNAAIARLAATQILHYAGIHPPKPTAPTRAEKMDPRPKPAVFNGGANVPPQAPPPHTTQSASAANEIENQESKIENDLPKPTDSIGGGRLATHSPIANDQPQTPSPPDEIENQKRKTENRLLRFLTAILMTTLLAQSLMTQSAQRPIPSTQLFAHPSAAPRISPEPDADWGIMAGGGRMASAPVVRSGLRRPGAGAWPGFSFRGGAMVNEATVLEALGELRNCVRGVKIFEGNVSVQVPDMGGARPKWELRKKIDEALARVEGVGEVFVDFVAGEESRAGGGVQAGGGGQGKPAGHSHGHEHGAGEGGGSRRRAGFRG